MRTGLGFFDDDPTVQAQDLKRGAVIDYGPWSHQDGPETAIVFNVLVGFEPEMTTIVFVGGEPEPLHVASDWPMTLDTPEAADMRASLVMEEADRLHLRPEG